MNKRVLSLIAFLALLIAGGFVFTPEDEARFNNLETIAYGLGTPHVIFQTATEARKTQTPNMTLAVPTRTTVPLPTLNFETPTQEQFTPVPVSRLMEVTANPCLNVRSGPDLRAPVVACANRGERLNIGETLGGFAKVATGQYAGRWLSLSYLKDV